MCITRPMFFYCIEKDVQKLILMYRKAQLLQNWSDLLGCTTIIM